MAPERIKGDPYTIRSDVWSTGLSLLEFAQNRFPYPPDLGESWPCLVSALPCLVLAIGHDCNQLTRATMIRKARSNNYKSLSKDPSLPSRKTKREVLNGANR